MLAQGVEGHFHSTAAPSQPACAASFVAVLGAQLHRACALRRAPRGGGSGTRTRFTRRAVRHAARCARASAARPCAAASAVGVAARRRAGRRPCLRGVLRTLRRRLNGVGRCAAGRCGRGAGAARRRGYCTAAARGCRERSCGTGGLCCAKRVRGWRPACDARGVAAGRAGAGVCVARAGCKRGRADARLQRAWPFLLWVSSGNRQRARCRCC